MNNVQELSLRDRKKSVRRDLLLDVARGMIADNGLRSLKIRDVAEAAGCSVGSVYNEFGDFDGLILEVNRGVVASLDAGLSRVPDKDPVRHLRGLAGAYLDFAREHPNLLRSLFEHRMEDDKPFPPDILQAVMKTFSLMYGPLRLLMPDARSKKVALTASSLFSAVHGIISLGLEERLVAVPPSMLRRQVVQFVDVHLAGLGIDPH